MDISNLPEPTTVIGLAAIAIGAVVYVTNTMSARFTKHLEEKDKNYQNFVLERNHQTGEIITKNTEVLAKVGENMIQNTESVKELIALHLKK